MARCVATEKRVEEEESERNRPPPKSMEEIAAGFRKDWEREEEELKARNVARRARNEALNASGVYDKDEELEEEEDDLDESVRAERREARARKILADADRRNLWPRKMMKLTGVDVEREDDAFVAALL